MRLTNFKIESHGYEIFEGFTKNEGWNGWACPYFTFDQAHKVMNQYNQFREIVREGVGEKDFAFYDSVGDAFVFPSDDEDDFETFTAIEENNQSYYPVGTFCWI